MRTFGFFLTNNYTVTLFGTYEYLRNIHYFINIKLLGTYEYLRNIHYFINIVMNKKYYNSLTCVKIYLNVSIV